MARLERVATACLALAVILAGRAVWLEAGQATKATSAGTSEQQLQASSASGAKMRPTFDKTKHNSLKSFEVNSTVSLKSSFVGMINDYKDRKLQQNQQDEQTKEKAEEVDREAEEEEEEEEEANEGTDQDEEIEAEGVEKANSVTKLIDSKRINQASLRPNKLLIQTTIKISDASQKVKPIETSLDKAVILKSRPFASFVTNQKVLDNDNNETKPSWTWTKRSDRLRRDYQSNKENLEKHSEHKQSEPNETSAKLDGNSVSVPLGASTQKAGKGSSGASEARPKSDLGSDSTSMAIQRELSMENSFKCRVEKNLYLDFEEYRHYSCAFCYYHVPKISFTKKLEFRKEFQGWLYDLTTNRSLLPNETETIRATFKSEHIFIKWRDCCRQAVECCQENEKFLPKLEVFQVELVDKPEVCPATWDGLDCWPDTPAGQIAQHTCPPHVFVLDFEPSCKGQAVKQCFSNGSWYIRNGHEWTDFRGCNAVHIYANRLLFGSVWHVISAIVIGPSLIILDKMPNRSNSKRVKILSSLLFWLLANCLFAATQKIAIINGIFQADTNPDEKPLPPSSSHLLANSSLTNNLASSSSSNLVKLSTINKRHSQLQQQQNEIGQFSEDITLLTSANSTFSTNNNIIKLATSNETEFSMTQFIDKRDKDEIERTSQNRTRNLDDHNVGIIDQIRSDANETMKSVTIKGDNHEIMNAISADSNDSILSPQRKQMDSFDLVHNDKLSQHQTWDSGGKSGNNARVRFDRFKRSTPNHGRQRRQSVPVVILCWILSVAIRVTRQLSYTWMFTGGVYLCSVLHFAPAEPPAAFIGILMFVTNGFPVVIALVYVIARTIYEPSPLNLLLKLPYFYSIGDKSYVEYLWTSQLECWLAESRVPHIEEIAGFPNLVLIVLNGSLFVVTLIIMCRITRPGSTSRPEMSLRDYFRAAGTLVFLYGAHYTLFVYKPEVDDCIKSQVLYYAFVFVDGLQGMAVSYVFCYRTNEGREIIFRWWNSCLIYKTSHKRKDEKIRDHRLSELNNRSNHSTRSYNSACNGNELATELIDFNDNSTPARF